MLYRHIYEICFPGIYTRYAIQAYNRYVIQAYNRYAIQAYNKHAIQACYRHAIQARTRYLKRYDVNKYNLVHILDTNLHLLLTNGTNGYMCVVPPKVFRCDAG